MFYNIKRNALEFALSVSHTRVLCPRGGVSFE